MPPTALGTQRDLGDGRERAEVLADALGDDGRCPVVAEV
jgi:hypothetical protein